MNVNEITNYTVHADDLATTSEEDWGTYAEQTEKSDHDFLTLRGDVFDTSDLKLNKKDQ